MKPFPVCNRRCIVHEHGVCAIVKGGFTVYQGRAHRLLGTGVLYPSLGLWIVRLLPTGYRLLPTENRLLPTENRLLPTGHVRKLLI